MAVKIIDVLVTRADTDVSWQGIRDNFTNWNDVKECSDWREVAHLGIKSPLTVTVGTPIKVTVAAVDMTWEVIANNFRDWSAVSTEFTNWNSVLNYH